MNQNIQFINILNFHSQIVKLNKEHTIIRETDSRNW